MRNLPEVEIDTTTEFDMNSKMEYMTSGAEVDVEEDINFLCKFVTGAAGTGKTYSLKQQVADDPKFGILCATTGIAAINLEARTINSVLKYFDTASLRDAYINNGRLERTIGKLHTFYRNIIIDEASMLAGEQLDLLFKAVRDHNTSMGNKHEEPFGIILVGDLLQLPPVKAKWIFEAKCWPHFVKNTEVLTKIWRQDDATFLDAINFIRAGDGEAGTVLLKKAGVLFAPSVDHAFDGTTIYAKNKSVDNHNSLRLDDLETEQFTMSSYRWGDLGAECDKIPHLLALKPGALVMVLTNHTDFTYVNGDLGIIDRAPGAKDTGVWIRLQRTNKLVCIPYIVRTKQTDSYYKDDKPVQVDEVPIYSEWIKDDTGTVVEKAKVDAPWNEVYYDPEIEKFIVGAVKYLPLRLGYATTTHKSQGLSLDMVQLDPRENFFGTPGMAYVALSRARTPKGLRIVGPAAVFAARVKIDEKVKEWV